jgi:2-dehydro-3-deoxyphosphogluconate aldolase / (4S)-4-hydroxy-2-oxoglutarate aldolase
MDTLIDKFEHLGIIPVIEIEDSKDAVPLAQALIAGGLPIAEVTFRTEAAQKAIQNMAQNAPGMIVGAGTVLNVSQAEQAVASGARFIVSPGFSPTVVRWCLDHGIAVFPGVATPTEITQALDYGLQVLKFFPAEALGGVKVLKALSGPFKKARFIPTGGISGDNLPYYLALPSVLACGGSWIAPKKLITSCNFAEITQLTIAAANLVKQIRSKE